MVRPREIRARNNPTNGDHATHRPEKQRPAIHPIRWAVKGKAIEGHTHKAVDIIPPFSTKALVRTRYRRQIR